MTGERSEAEPGESAESAGLAGLVELLAASPSGLVRLDPAGRITWANPAATRLLLATVGPTGTTGNLVDTLGPWWPELPELLAPAPPPPPDQFTDLGPGPNPVPAPAEVVANHRLTSPSTPGSGQAQTQSGAPSWALAVSVTRLATGDLLVTLVDATDQARREQELADGRQRLHAYVEGAADGIITIDERGRIESTNPSAQRLFGYGPGELIGRNISELMDEPHRSAHDGYLRRHRDTGESRVIGRTNELQGRRADGTLFPIELSVTEITLPGGERRFTGTVHDISIRARAQADLASREAELSTLFASIDEGFAVAEMVVDSTGRAVDYRFLEINPLFESMTGLTDPAGRTALELVPDLEATWIETYARVGLGGETLRFEDGSEAMGRWFDVFATPLPPTGRFAIVFKDQTQRHVWDRQLRESEERFRTMANELPLLVWEADASGRQIWVNQTFRTYFEPVTSGGPGAASGRPAFSWRHNTHPEDAPAVRARYEEAVAERGSFHAELRARRADGAWRWLESWARPRVTEDGELLGFIGTSVDITERKEAEGRLQRTAARDAYRARLGDVLRVAASPAEIEAGVSRALERHLGAWRVHYSELEPDGVHAMVRLGHHLAAHVADGRYRLDDFGAEVMDEVRAGRAVTVYDMTIDGRFTPAERLACRHLGLLSYAMVPLVSGGRTTAMLVAHHREPHHWTADEVAALEETAERTWSSIERARAEQELERRHARALLLANVLSDLEDESTVASQLQRLVQNLVPALADYATIETPDDDEPLRALAHRDPEQAEVLRALRLEHRLGQRSDHSVAWVAAGQSQLLAELDPAAYGQFGASPEAVALLLRLEPRSHMAVPVGLGTEQRGALLVGRTAGRPPFGPDDMEFLQELAERASVVLRATHLRRVHYDVSLRLQRALLPDSLEWHPNVQIEGHYDATSEFLEVGGDWYETFAWADGHLGLIVGDVVGHNLDSVVAMSRLRSGTSVLAGRLPPSPSGLLTALDGYARERDGTSFTTVVCLVIDPDSGLLRYSSAGHLPALVVSPGGVVTRLDRAQSLPLCSIPSGPRPEATVALEPGSLVVVYSDGLVERRGLSIDDGISRLEALAAELAGLPLSQLPDALATAMTAGSPPQDDLVVTCLRYTPAMARHRSRLPADISRLAGLRDDLRRWLDGRGVEGRAVQDLLLVVTEAATNAIEHGYHDRSPDEIPEEIPEEIEVEVTDHGFHLAVRVTDQGTWRPVGSHSRGRGWGTDIMTRVATRFVRRSTPQGTSVVLTLAIPDRPTASRA